MLSLHVVCAVVLTISSIQNVCAFVSKKPSDVASSTSQLHAMPPMVIGPMLRKMREEKQKARMPMATEGEMKGQAPGLRVGGSAWKWPPVWPYDQTLFTPPEDVEQPDAASQLNGVAGMLSGVAQVPTPEEIEVKDEDKFDVVKYWQEQKANVKTELDEESVERLKR